MLNRVLEWFITKKYSIHEISLTYAASYLAVTDYLILLLFS